MDLTLELQQLREQFLQHEHTNVDQTLPVSIFNIKNFPSTPSDGDTVIFNAATNQWVASQGTTTVNGRSHGSASTTIATGTNTKVQLNVNDFANGITWDATNHVFTIVTAGNYLITAQVTYSGTTTASTYRVFVAGATTSQAAAYASVTAGGQISISSTDIQTLSVGSTVELDTDQFTGGNATLATGTGQTYLSLTKI